MKTSILLATAGLTLGLGTHSEIIMFMTKESLAHPGFIFGEKGLIGDLSLEGAKITRLRL
jgi:hypothetical protein